MKEYEKQMHKNTMNGYVYKFEDNPRSVAKDIAVKDLVRLGASIYKAVGRSFDQECHAEGELPVSAGGIEVASGRGPEIYLDGSWGVFKASYAIAQRGLIALIRPHIEGNTRRFELTFHHSVYESFGCHGWRVFGASAESEAQNAAGDVTAEDAARVLRV